MTLWMEGTSKAAFDDDFTTDWPATRKELNCLQSAWELNSIGGQIGIIESLRCCQINSNHTWNYSNQANDPDLMARFWLPPEQRNPSDISYIEGF